MDQEVELTRHLPGDNQKTSSLRSSTPPAAEAEEGSSSRPASPALSTSSTADEGGSSPILPPLPQPTINGRTLEIRTPPSESRTTSSHYYTASWGSPYQQPITSTTRTRSYNHSLSSELSEDSPIRHLEFHTPYLRPAPGLVRSHTEPDFVSHDGLISAAVLANRARRRPNGLTEDWIRQHTGGEDREANNWLSDDPGESEHSSLSGSTSDNANWDLDQRTPTLKRFLQSRNPRPSRHRRQQTTDTLRQEDFLDFEVPRMSLNSNTLSPEEMGPASSHEDMPPPPPPKEEWRAAMLPALNEAASDPTIAPALAPPRLKKKVPWKGKNILVLLPRDEDRGQRGKAPTPMTEKEVNVMMKEWEQLGYDTTGFNLGPGSDDEGIGARGQSRSTWPKSEDLSSERKERSFRVSIPDRKEWDAYVRELSEAKLRALGVSFGDEEPAPQPAVSSNVSRRTSMQYPALPFSPPIPTNSAASSHAPNPFSPVLMPGAGLSTNQSSHPGSIASPASLQAHMQGKYNPRQSVSFSGSEHPFGSPFQYPQQTNSPGVWSPQQMLNLQGVPRGGSPAVQNFGSIMTPTSPFSPDGYFPQGGDVLSQMQQRQHSLQNQLALQQQLQMHGAMASPRLQEVREIPDEEDITISKSPSKTPEARQIKHNPSASLQKEIDDAEYHLEEQMQRQLEHDDYSPHSEKEDDRFSDKAIPESKINLPTNGLAKSRFATTDSEDGPVLHHPQPHSRGHSLSQKPFHDSEESAAESKNGVFGAEKLADKVAVAEQSDLETNPSNLGTPVPSNDFSGSGHERALSVSSNPWADSELNHTEDGPRKGHSAKASMSTLNVAAKEFKFDPSSTFHPPSIFSPSQFSFGANSFQPSNIAAYSNFTQPMSATSSHFSNPSITSSKGKINVAASSFQPGNGEFSFSSSGPSFRPDAPVFTPSFTSTFSSSVGSAGSGSEGPRTSIFGNIDLSSLGISKPSKKSKAVPIIRPDSSHSKTVEDENTEDKDGRITQGESRIKRVRGSNTDGDSVPLFAEPGMPLGETTRDQSPPKETLVVATTPADKENSAPLPEEDNERSPQPPVKSHSRNLSAFSNPPEPANNFAPREFQEKKHAEDFNAARPFTSRRYGSGLPAYGFLAASDEEDNEFVPAQEPVKRGHGRTPSSLSATAKPFEFKSGNFNIASDDTKPEPVPTVLSPPPVPKEEPLPKLKVGLSASRFARSPTPPAKIPTPPAREVTPPAVAMSPEVSLDADESASFQAALPQPQSPPSYEVDHDVDVIEREPTFEEIDAVMRQLNEAELESAPGRELDTPGWHESIPARHITMPDIDVSSPIRLRPQNLMRSDAPSPSPRRFYPVPGETRIFTRMHEDPFVGGSLQQDNFDAPVHNLNNMHSGPPSEWNDDFSENEEAKLQPRAQFFDNHVNNLVGGLLAERLDPLERTLENIQMSLDMMAASSPSRRRERRSVSGALSDADDEDDDNPRRSLSPRRNRKMDQIRVVVTEAMNAHSSRPQTATTSVLPDSRNVLQALDEMKEQFGQSMRLDFRAEDLRNIVEEAVEKRMPPSPKPFVDEAAATREVEHKSKIADLEEKLLNANSQSSTHLTVLDTQAQRFEEKLSRVEDSHSSRVSELEERLAAAEAKNEEELKTRRAAEDRLAEVQRLLRISSEEETRLRETMDERETKHKEILNTSDLKVRHGEEQRSKTTMKIALLEAAQGNTQKTQSDLQNRVNISENDLRTARQDIHRWQMEAERALEAARRHSEDAEAANEMNKDLRRTIDTLRSQMEESIRVREGMRGKLMVLQEDMAAAARSISEENFRRAKKEQELVARQEVLDARLQAEARTRERLETEIERLEQGERDGMRAVSEMKKVENLIAELRMESHDAKTDALKFQREFEEARESGLSEVKRTKHYMQAEIDSSNNQVNVVREELEHEISRLHREIDQVKLDADTARAKSEMLLEEAESSKKSLLDDLKQTHEDRLEDLHTQHERQLNNTLEDSQRTEQHLLERLSLSSAKTEHLQDRVTHLTEKLEIASQAASAAVTAAKTARSTGTSQSAPKPLARALELPEKISPQALRESIMVLQEQLQSREQTIEELEAQVEKMDPDAGSKIAKRDDEIIWLRELLSVRKSDLLDIVSSLEGSDYDAERVRDAAIRLRANLQMEEQERERALNGGSALGIPTLTSLRDAAIASPRVAQAVGPLAAAWGNWRKTRTDSGAGIEGVMNRDRSSSSTPSKNSPAGQSFLSGLLTPPASSARQGTPNTTGGIGKQPTAFGSTGQRFTSAQLANRPGGRLTPRQVQPMRGSMSGNAPKTPPMLRKASYDDDAEQRRGFEAADFSDAGFYDDDESPVDDAYGEVIAAMR